MIWELIAAIIIIAVVLFGLIVLAGGIIMLFILAGWVDIDEIGYDNEGTESIEQK